MTDKTKNRSEADFDVVDIDPHTSEWIYEDPSGKRYIDGDTVETWSPTNLRARELFHLLLVETLKPEHRELLREEHYRRWDFEPDHCPSQHNNDGDDICEDCGEDLQWAGDEEDELTPALPELVAAAKDAVLRFQFDDVDLDRLERALKPFEVVGVPEPTPAARARMDEGKGLLNTIAELDKRMDGFATRARNYLESIRPEESAELVHLRHELKETKQQLELEKRDLSAEYERATRLAKSHMRYRKQIDDALGVTPEQRQLAAGAGFAGALKLLLTRHQEAKEWRDAILNALESKPEFQAAEWSGDKRGWGFVFEFINWLYRERTETGAKLQQAKEQIKRLDEQVRQTLTISDRNLGVLKSCAEALGVVINPERMVERIELLLGCAVALEFIVGRGAQFEEYCDQAEHDEDSLCIFCEARKALAAARESGVLSRYIGPVANEKGETT